MLGNGCLLDHKTYYLCLSFKSLSQEIFLYFAHRISGKRLDDLHSLWDLKVCKLSFTKADDFLF